MNIHHSVFDFHGSLLAAIPPERGDPVGRAGRCRDGRGEESSPIGGARAEGGAITDPGSERGTELAPIRNSQPQRRQERQG